MSVERKSYIIERLPEGGYYLAEFSAEDKRAIFASKSIDDVLKFVREGFEPKPEGGQKAGAGGVLDVEAGIKFREMIKNQTHPDAYLR